jgi:hypothetical protein
MMDKDISAHEQGSSLKSWLVVIGIAVLFLCWGLVVYFTVGDKGPAPWRYGVVEDIPGESPFSTERGWSRDPTPQHVND